MMQALTLLRGNAHAEIMRGNDGQVIDRGPFSTRQSNNAAAR